MQAEPPRGKEVSSYTDLDESILHPIVSLVETSGVHTIFMHVYYFARYFNFFVSYDYVHFEGYMIARIQCYKCCSSTHMICR